ncbi:helix-turn-helix domain-containing protein [Eubacterium sp.]|uniref:helix-turn-helix domain-containing protein n=1 Tax=Eubacterium sp. TaxID=142586 RepID=UPI0026DEE670|nr:helix-turn-helix transcriptional regulator [Eubacterium sp.]MDO5433355.1 helix-turn-helix transcriptional regulator [Eubacterium sp.]
MEINERIRLIRKHNKMSMRAFGEALGVSGDVIGNIEYDRLKKPEQKEPIYMLICEKFGVNEKWLRTGEGDMFVSLSEEDELGAYLGKIGTGDYPEIEKIIKAYFRLPEESQHAVDLFLNSLTGDSEN